MKKQRMLALTHVPAFGSVLVALLALAVQGELLAVTETRSQARKRAECTTTVVYGPGVCPNPACNTTVVYKTGTGAPSAFNAVARNTVEKQSEGLVITTGGADGVTRDIKRHSPEMPALENLILAAEECAVQQTVKRMRPNFAEILKSDNGLAGITLEASDLEKLPKGYARWLVHDVLRRNDTNANNIALLSRHCTFDEAIDLSMEADIAERQDVIAVLTQQMKEFREKCRQKALLEQNSHALVQK